MSKKSQNNYPLLAAELLTLILIISAVVAPLFVSTSQNQGMQTTRPLA